MLIVIIGPAKAQDLLITKDSERIEAQITEISDSEVKFKRLDNMDGPIFVLSADKIASIVFANGEVFVFKSNGTEEQHPSNDNTATPPIEKETNQVPLIDRTIVIGSGAKAKTIVMEEGMSYQEYRMKYHLSQLERVYFLEQACPSAYKEKIKANRNFAASLVGLGVTAALLPNIGKNSNKSTNWFLASLGFTLYFELSWLYHVLSIDSEFEKCTKGNPPTTTLSLSLKDNGLCVSFNF